MLPQMERPASMIEVGLLTPEIAKGLLIYSEEKFRNRTTHHTRVELLANEILANNWEDSNDAICTDEEGVLINGYHRCKAVIQANKSIWVTFKRGMSREAFHSMDQGKKRSVADVLRTKSVPHGTTVARACRILFLYEQVGISCLATTADPLVSNRDVLNVFDRNPSIVESATFIYKRSRLAKMLAPGFLAFAHHRLLKIHDPLTIQVFYDGIDKGDNIDNDSPIKLLRMRYIDDALTIGGKNLKRSVKYGLFVKAWNLYVQDKKLQRLVFSENSNEQIPDFK